MIIIIHITLATGVFEKYIQGNFCKLTSPCQKIIVYRYDRKLLAKVLNHKVTKQEKKSDKQLTQLNLFANHITFNNEYMRCN